MREKASFWQISRGVSSVILLSGVVGLVCSVEPQIGQAQVVPKVTIIYPHVVDKLIEAKPMPKETITAWEKSFGNRGSLQYTQIYPFGSRRTELEKDNLFEFRLLDCDWAAEALEDVPAPPVPFALKLSSTRITDAGLKELAKFDNLVRLHLDGTRITDEGLKDLKGLKNLQHLDLTRTLVTDAGLKELAELKNLHTLSLNETAVTSAGLKELAGLKEMQNLYLMKTQVGDEGLKSLTGMTKLKTLLLYDSQVTDAGLKHLAGLKLRYLMIPPQTKTDQGLKHYLAAIEDVPLTLDLSSWKITDEGLKELAKCKNLKKLNLIGTNVTPAGVAELRKALPECRMSY